MPFHVWDYHCAARSWDFVPGGGAYVPSSEDIAYGDMLRRHWLSLAINGTAGAGEGTQ